jgi:1,4-dihydroxy-2-naphthoate octaprenyltransferase
MRKDLLIAHLGLSVLATLLIELARKMRPREQDTAQDTYSWRLGIGGANAIYIFITVATAVFATRILAITGKLLLYALPLAISLTIAIAAAYHYFRRSDPQSSDLVAGSALLTYFAAHGTIILGLMA